MNKKLKIATAAVSVVMAGTMVFGIFGCGDSGKTPGGNTPGGNTPGGEIVERTDIKYDENHHLTYAAKTPISVNAGNGSKATDYQSISYSKELELGGTVKMPDGKEYNSGNLKPAWKALETQLNVTLTDTYTHLKSEEQLTDPKTKGTLGDYDIITASASAITQNTDVLVNINDYLDYMPNYKAFLEANPVTRWSLTSDTATGAMYYAPYFDGNDDIEKYCMTEHSWVVKMLDQESTDTVTFKQQAEKKSITYAGAKATSYMGKTGSWTVQTSKPGDTSAVPAVGYVKVDYDAVIAALNDTSAGLGKALKDAGVTTIDKTSGNIVELQNQAITASNGAVTGAQLNKITQEYIKVAYKYSDTENGTYGQLYGATVNGVTTKLSDVFLSTYAAWDIDLLTALSRCVVTNPTLLGGSADNLANIYGIAARQGTTQRRSDLTALAGELYGIRGLESRYENMYVGADGSIKDPRLDKNTYELMANFSKLAQEGLVYTGDEKIDGQPRDITSKISMLMMHDYSNTQSKANWTTSTKLAPVSTPVSKWDTDDNGSHETVMRFTESWRSVKNTGFCLTKDGAASSPDKLSACLALIDYMFSNDGQLLMTYGPKSSSNTDPDGWWIGTDELDIASNLDKVEKIADATSYAPAQYSVKANADGSRDYFAYNGKLYKGQAYAGGYVPKMTTASSDFYQGKEVNGVAMKKTDKLMISAIYNYTGYARKVIGTTLPIGNKNQGFEYQATEAFALSGTETVNKCVLNGTIKHVKISVDKNEKWYLICPTSFALDTNTQTFLKTTAQTDISGKYFLNDTDTKTKSNLFIDMLLYGFDTTRSIGGVSNNGPIPANGEKCVEFLNKVDNAMTARVSAINAAWSKTKTAFKIFQ